MKNCANSEIDLLGGRSVACKAYTGATIACVLLLVASAISVREQVRLAELARTALELDAVQSRWAGQAALSALQCRRYEKDAFLNATDSAALAAYVGKWAQSLETLQNDVRNLKQSCSLPEDVRDAQWYLAATERYRQRFMEVVELVKEGRIAGPEAANRAMSPFKDDVRAIIGNTASMAEAKSVQASQSAESFSQSLYFNVVATCILTVMPIVVIIGWTIWLTREITRRNMRLASLYRELDIRHQSLDAANHSLAMQVDRADRLAFEAQTATRVKSEFLANMSHEIRTPMTSILGYTDLLMNDSLDAEDRKAYLTTVRRNSAHLLQLINDILDLSKIEAGKMTMQLGPCRLTALVADVASMMRPRAEQRKNTLEVRYSGPVPETIQTDGERVRQVLVNLVGNAVKFTDSGSVRIEVSFLPQWRPDTSAVSLAVTDTGIGIRKDALVRLFEPFMQAESSTTRKYGGTGLGLAISRRIVKALSGTIKVRSIPGEGSTFTVTIPTGDITGARMLQSPAEAISENETPAQWSPSPDLLCGVKILLAEDSLDNQLLLRTVLGHVGARVETVENGRLAVQRAQAADFDVILMDMSMPEMDGYQASQCLRDCGYQRPILALTAHAMAGDAERCLAAGCNAYLAKPIDRKQLVETVAKYAKSDAGQPYSSVAKQPGSVSPGPTSTILSQFADDPVLAEILSSYVHRLPEHVEVLAKALAEQKLPDVDWLAHQLKGSAGSYGFPSLGEAAHAVELAARAGDMAAADAAMATVQQINAAIQAGWAAHAAY